MLMTTTSGIFKLARLKTKRTIMTMQTWTGRTVTEQEILYDEISPSTIPSFGRENFEGDNGAINQYLDVIYNEVCGTPVATVSKGYSLIQHRTALASTMEALAQMGYSEKADDCDLTITELGERMWLRIRFPEFTFDPGDGYNMNLELSLFNSVDGSMTFGFEVGWYRLICKNGLVTLDHGKTMNRRHTKSLLPSLIVKELQKSITETLNGQKMYRHWHEKKVSIGKPINYTSSFSLEDWIDETLSKDFGKRTAARAYHIMKTGYDGKVDITEANDRTRTAHKVSVSLTDKVPGSKPVENALDIAHTLSFIASHQESIKTRIDMNRKVPKIMHSLIPKL